MKQNSRKAQKVETRAIEKAETVTPNYLLQLAIENKADVAYLDKLLDLQLKYEANEDRKAYIVAMTQFRASCPAINKTKPVDFGGGGATYKYAPLGVTIDAIKDIMSECGLSHSWRMSQTNGTISVTCKVTHIKGHSEDTTMVAPPDDSGRKNAIQQIASTVSYLERYTLFALLGLASQDMDDDGRGAGEKQKTSQQKLMEAMLREAYEVYAAKKKALLSAGSEISLDKFKAELKKQYGSLSAENKAAFQWTVENIEKLAEKIDPNKVIGKAQKNDKKTEGQ